VERKKVKYRKLKLGEIIRRGDVWYSELEGKWEKTSMAGNRVGWDPSFMYRRPIKAKKGKT
jgi:hypothetical protein